MLSIPHIIVIFIVVLVIFGPEKLPELARNFGKVMAEFRRATGDLRSSFDAHMRDIEREAESRRIASATVAAPAPPTATEPASPGTAPAEPPPAELVAGTVPTAPPNASAYAPARRTQEPAETKYAMNDPYLQGTGLDAPSAAPASSEPEKTSDQVTDGNARPA